MLLWWATSFAVLWMTLSRFGISPLNPSILSANPHLVRTGLALLTTGLAFVSAATALFMHARKRAEMLRFRQATKPF